jgi:hypothetical protein
MNCEGHGRKWLAYQGSNEHEQMSVRLPRPQEESPECEADASPLF